MAVILWNSHCVVQAYRASSCTFTISIWSDFAKHLSPQDRGSIIPTCDLCVYSQQSSALPSEIILLVAHGCLLGFYKHNFLLVPFIQTMRVTCQSDGTWTGPLFLLRWTESHVDKSLQKGKVAAVLLRCSEPWKDNTNKFERNSMVPHTITEDATCPS